MLLRSALLSLAASALLLAPSASRADEDIAQANRLADSWGVADHGRHGHHGHHPSMPPRPWPGQGRYELQTVQRWVPGRYEQVWVPEDCRFRPRRNRTVCRGGYYDQQWVAGHYETIQEWVWVPANPRRGYTVTLGG